MGYNKVLYSALCRSSVPGLASEIYVSFVFPFSIFLDTFNGL